MKNNFIAILIFLVACTDPYAGFNEIDEGVYFKLNELGKESSPLNKADYILIDYDFCEDSNCEFKKVFSMSPAGLGMCRLLQHSGGAFLFR